MASSLSACWSPGIFLCWHGRWVRRHETFLSLSCVWAMGTLLIVPRVAGYLPTQFGQRALRYYFFSFLQYMQKFSKGKGRFCHDFILLCLLPCLWPGVCHLPYCHHAYFQIQWKIVSCCLGKSWRFVAPGPSPLSVFPSVFPGCKFSLFLATPSVYTMCPTSLL